MLDRARGHFHGFGCRRSRHVGWDLKSLAFRRLLPVSSGVEHYRRTAHTRFDIKFHLVWITKYRKKLLRGDDDFRVDDA
jgi:hypothetical protein